MGGGCFDVKEFPAFTPLLEVCQEYAKLSGCRFRESSFDGVDADSQAVAAAVEADAACGDCDDAAAMAFSLRVGRGQRRPLCNARFVTKLQAEPQVRLFLSRLRSGEPELE